MPIVESKACKDRPTSTYLIQLLAKIIKTHSSVSCGPRNQENLGVWQTSVYFTGVRKTPFSRICSSKLPVQKHTKFLCKFPWGGAPPILNLSWIHHAVPEICAFKNSSYFLRIFLFFFFSQHLLNGYNSCVLCWIALKFGPLLQHIKAYLWFNFCSKWIKKHWVLNDFQNFQVWSLSRLQVKPLQVAWIGWNGFAATTNIGE